MYIYMCILIEMLCMHVHFSPIIKYIYNLFEFDSPWQFYFCHIVIFWVGPAQMISFWVNFIKNVVLLCFNYDNFMYCMYLWRFSFELTHFLYSHGVLRDDAQWRIISPVMQSGQVYNQYRCTITCNDNG